MDTSDIERLRAKLNALKGHWPRIAAIGKFDYSWVVRFANGIIQEPKLSKLGRLKDAMATLKAEIATLKAA